VGVSCTVKEVRTASPPGPLSTSDRGGAGNQARFAGLKSSSPPLPLAERGPGSEALS